LHQHTCCLRHPYLLLATSAGRASSPTALTSTTYHRDILPRKSLACAVPSQNKKRFARHHWTFAFRLHTAWPARSKFGQAIIISAHYMVGCPGVSTCLLPEGRLDLLFTRFFRRCEMSYNNGHCGYLRILWRLATCQIACSATHRTLDQWEGEVMQCFTSEASFMRGQRALKCLGNTVLTGYQSSIYYFQPSQAL
jgi:hypothetical protein